MTKIEIKAYQEGNKKDVLTDFLDSLTDKNDVKKIRKLTRMLELQGRDLGFPLSRFLGSGVYELRDQSAGFRIYYTFVSNILVVLLVLGDKKTQQKDIERAKVRRTKLLSEYEV